jgi:hypothetical protein
MTRISPTDLSFLLLERANRPNHMAAFTIFQKPKDRSRFRTAQGPGMIGTAWRPSPSITS